MLRDIVYEVIYEEINRRSPLHAIPLRSHLLQFKQGPLCIGKNFQKKILRIHFSPCKSAFILVLRKIGGYIVGPTGLMAPGNGSSDGIPLGPKSGSSFLV
jgi:hypothetical protein